MDHEAVVVGAGHNGLITAADLARAGMRTLLVEARDTVGGCASTVDALGGRVNICNCDHVVFRTTPVIEELGLEGHGLRYLDIDPAQINMAWKGGPAWPIFHDVDRTLDALARTYPHEVEGYRRYVDAAVPVAELVLEMANDAPTAGSILKRVAQRRGRGVATLLDWSRTSVADVLRRYFSEDAVMAPLVVTGPAVWGLSPYTPGTGAGALTYAMKHAGHGPGRPVGGSGAVPQSILAAFEAAGGTLRTSTRVTGILCEGERVRGVELDDGSVVDASVVVVAADPREAFVRWLRNPPASAATMVGRWRAAPQHEGYESKIDAIVSELPQFRAIDNSIMSDLGVDDPLNATVIVAPSFDAMHAAHEQMKRGRIAEEPMLFCNVPSVLDESMRTADGEHVLSLEVLYTPYALEGGWDGSPEPERWLRALEQHVQPGFVDRAVRRWRAMTPPVYESDFTMPRGYATSFAGGPVAALLGRQKELTRYETPIGGLYLTGAATFPGAGVWGAAGRNAAQVVLRGR